MRKGAQKVYTAELIDGQLAFAFVSFDKKRIVKDIRFFNRMRKKAGKPSLLRLRTLEVA